MTLDILICTLNARVARVPFLLREPAEGIHYVVSFQYTEDKYLESVPKILTEREDVTFVKLPGEGLSANRNNAILYAKNDLVYIIDDDNRFLPGTIETILQCFEQHEEVDIALFKSQTYLGRDLRNYPQEDMIITALSEYENVLTSEVVFRREKIQQADIHFNPNFGLGARLLPCYELQVWIYDALKKDLLIKFFPNAIIQSSKLNKPGYFYIDLKVQRSYGALLSYVYGIRAYGRAFVAAWKIASHGMGHFFPMLSHFLQGITIMNRIGKAQ